MKLDANSLRHLILTEARKIEQSLAEEAVVEVTPDFLRNIIQEEAAKFAENAQFLEAASEIEAAVMAEGDVDMPLPSMDEEDEVLEMEMLPDEPLEEDTFHREEMHDDEDVDRLRRMRDDLNAHIHNLEMQHDRAEDRHHERDEGELREDTVDEHGDLAWDLRPDRGEKGQLSVDAPNPASRGGEESDPHVDYSLEEDGQEDVMEEGAGSSEKRAASLRKAVQAALSDKNSPIEWDNDQGAYVIKGVPPAEPESSDSATEEGAKLTEGEKAAARLLRAAGIKDGNFVMTEGKLNEDVSSNVDRWLRLSGIR